MLLLLVIIFIMSMMTSSLPSSSTTSLIKFKVESSSMTTSSTKGTTSTTKELWENIIHIHSTRSPWSTSCFLLFYSFFSKLIIGFTFFCITEYLICSSNFLKFFLCPFWIIRIFIWMILDCKFLECFLDLRIISILFDP